MKDREFLMWLHERLEHVHKEDPLVDYMHKLRAIIINTDERKKSIGSSNSLKQIQVKTN